MSETQSVVIKERYILHEKLGEGGAAEVYRATQLHLEREVALKLIKADAQDRTFSARFQQEAKAVARLNHPNILQVYDFDQAEDGRYFMAMEYLPDGDLDAHFQRKLIKKELFPLTEVIRIVSSAAEGLDYAHTNGVIHRDVKPSNIYITAQNRVVVGDFGLAKLLNDKVPSKTQLGTVLGTPHYLSPEQIDGVAVDRRTDIYALGVVFFQLLTGHLPYEADTLSGVLTKHLYAGIPDPRQYQTGLHPLTKVIALRSLAKQAEDRYATMQEFIFDLNRLLPEALDDDRTLELTRPPLAERTPTTPLPAVPPASTAPLPTQSIHLQIPLWGVGIVLVGLVLALLGLAYGQWLRPTSDETKVVELPFAPAQPGEYLIMIAPMIDAETGVDVSQGIFDLLSNGNLKGSLGELLRIESLTIPITTESEALAAGQAGNANLIIWGSQDAASWHIMVQAPNRPENNLQKLELVVLNNPNNAVLLAEQTPILTEYYAKLLLISDVIRQNDLISAFYVTFTLEEFDPTIWELPATPLDRDVMELGDNLRLGDGFAADQAATNALRIAPDDLTLYYLRWATNILLGQADLAFRDGERLASLTENGAFAQALLAVTAYAFGQLEQLSQTAKPLTFQANSAATTAVGLSYQADLQLGNFAQALADITEYQTWLKAQNYPGNLFLDALLYLYQIQGDTSAQATLLPSFKDWRENRFYQEANRFFRSLQPERFAPISYSIGGLSDEMIGQPAMAQLTYAFGLGFHPNDYLLNWRQAVFNSQNGNYQQAYERYDMAAENAPVPFPIARFEQAQLVYEHEDELTEPRSPCDLLEEAHTLANSDTLFYAALLERIAALQAEAKCAA